MLPEQTQAGASRPTVGTWSEPVKVNLHVGPPQEKPAQQGFSSGFLNLKDGGMLAFLLIRHPLKDRANIWT